MAKKSSKGNGQLDMGLTNTRTKGTGNGEDFDQELHQKKFSTTAESCLVDSTADRQFTCGRFSDGPKETESESESDREANSSMSEDLISEDEENDDSSISESLDTNPDGTAASSSVSTAAVSIDVRKIAESVLQGNMEELFSKYLASLSPAQRAKTDDEIMRILKEKILELDSMDQIERFLEHRQGGAEKGVLHKEKEKEDKAKAKEKEDNYDLRRGSSIEIGGAGRRAKKEKLKKVEEIKRGTTIEIGGRNRLAREREEAESASVAVAVVAPASEREGSPRELKRGTLIEIGRRERGRGECASDSASLF